MGAVAHVKNPGRMTAALLIRAAGIIYRPRRAEFAGELDALQRDSGRSGIDFAFGTVVGATVERVTTVGQPLRIRQATKSYGGITAVDDVTLDVPLGAITALFGGNGAGKSTLLRLITGERTDAGDLYLGDTKIRPRIAERPVIVTPDNLGLFDNLTVAENLAIGAGEHWVVDSVFESAQASAALRSLGSSIDPSARVGDLAAPDHVIIAIARAVLRRSSVIVLDEPTRNLSAPAAARVLGCIERLRSEDVTVVCVSHRIDEVLPLCDRVVVMRDGAVVHECDSDATSPDEVVRHIVGERVA